MYIDIAILIYSASSIKILISVLHLLNGAQFLNATFVLLSAPATAVFPVTRIYASE